VLLVPFFYNPLFFNKVDCYYPDMASHLDIDDYVIDRDTLLPDLYTAGLPEFEAQPDMHPEILDTDWFLASLDSFDWTVDHEATAARIATTSGSTSNCLPAPETGRIPISYVVLSYVSTVLHADKYGWGHVSLTPSAFNSAK
jgi:hypothetical protein